MSNKPTPMTVDFSKAPEHRQHASGRVRHRPDTDSRPISSEGKLLTPKQIRARARRRAKRSQMMTDEEFQAIYKPIEEWDLEELARGRTRNSDGRFSGPAPKWISRDVHERSMDRFKAAIKTDMNVSTISALDAIRWVMENEECDEKGKPIVPASTKLDAAKFLLEHVVGKPTQRIENDVSVKLQSILGVVMANPAEVLSGSPGLPAGTGYDVGHLPGVTMPMATANGTIEGEIIDDDYDLDESGDA